MDQREVWCHMNINKVLFLSVDQAKEMIRLIKPRYKDYRTMYDVLSGFILFLLQLFLKGLHAVVIQNKFY